MDQQTILPKTTTAQPSEALAATKYEPLPGIDATNLKKFQDEHFPEFSKLTKITDTKSQSLVEAAIASIKPHIKDIGKVFDAECERRYTYHKEATSARSVLLTPAENYSKSLSKLLLDWVKAERLREEQRRIAEAQRLAKLEADRLAALPPPAIASLFGDEDDIPVPESEYASLSEFVPNTTAGQMVSDSGVGTRKLPWKAVIDLKALVIACAKRLEAGDDSLLMYLSANETVINALAKNQGEKISQFIPGVTAVQEETIKLS